MEEPLADCLARMDVHYRPSSVLVGDEVVASFNTPDGEPVIRLTANPALPRAIKSSKPVIRGLRLMPQS
jgi:hypothetical protein